VRQATLASAFDPATVDCRRLSTQAIPVRQQPSGNANPLWCCLYATGIARSVKKPQLKQIMLLCINIFIPEKQYTTKVI
jgi:hypothetical protein